MTRFIPLGKLPGLRADVSFLYPHNALDAIETVRDLDSQVALIAIASLVCRSVGNNELRPQFGPLDLSTSRSWSREGLMAARELLRTELHSRGSFCR
jgi:hypothetical protein